MRAWISAALMLAACASQPVSPPLPPHIREDIAQREAALEAPGVVAAGLGQTADLGGGLRVRPLAVVEDSRCPQNARCVWAGRLRVRVDVEGLGERHIDLGETPVTTPHGSFSLVAVLPGPWTDWPVDQRPAYRFGFSRSSPE